MREKTKRIAVYKKEEGEALMLATFEQSKDGIENIQCYLCTWFPEVLADALTLPEDQLLVWLEENLEPDLPSQTIFNTPKMTLRGLSDHDCYFDKVAEISWICIIEKFEFNITNKWADRWIGDDFILILLMTHAMFVKLHSIVSEITSDGSLDDWIVPYFPSFNSTKERRSEKNTEMETIVFKGMLSNQLPLKEEPRGKANKI